MPYNQYPTSAQAQGLANLGRYGDSMLVHMRPDEVAGLAAIARSQGGSLSINPHTGLVEAFGIKSITKPFKKIADDVLGIDDSGGIAGSLAKIVKPLGPLATIAGAYFGGPMGAALMAGLQGGDDRKAFNFKKAATAAALAYGAQAASQALGGNATFGEGAPAGTNVANIADVGIDPAAAAEASSKLAAASVEPATSSILDTITNPQTYTDLASKAVDPNTYKDLASSAVDTITNPQTYSDLASSAVDYAKQSVSSPLEALKTASTATTAYSGVKTLQELDAQKEEAARILADQANQKAEDIAWARSVMASYRPTYTRAGAQDVASWNTRNMAQGGITALASGGSMPPRYLSGGGDGMSDSIKANIDGKQEARLADGEFVVPADVVSHLGNGSSNAGAKRLYAMMDKVRKARTGKKSQAPAVNVQKMMPV